MTHLYDTAAQRNGNPAPEQNGRPRRRYIFKEQMKIRQLALRRQRGAEARERRPEPHQESRNPLDYLSCEKDPKVVYRADGAASLGLKPNDALLVSQLAYWYSPPPATPEDGEQLPRARALVGEDYLLDKSRQELAYETGLSIDQVKRSIASLQGAGLITTRGQGRLIIRLTDELVEALNALAAPENESGNTTAASILVHADVVRMLSGNVAAAVTLAQICYWHGASRGRCRLRVCKDDHFWLAKSHTELARETGLSARQTKHALQLLEDRHLIAREYFRFDGMRTTHIRLDSERFADAWVQQVTEGSR